MENNEPQLNKIRHSAAHLLAFAVKELWKDTKIAIGPVIEEGFYYDFDFAKPISEEDLDKIEKKMLELSKQNFEFVQEWISVEKARELFKGESYKLEIIEEIEKGKRDDFGKKGEVSIYKSGSFVDLCKGPHVQKIEEVKAFKLLSLAGAYWKGDEKNKMLTRVYGTAFESKKDLEKYLEMLEEAKKRDHRRLGKELDLFTFSDLVGAGLPLYTAKGTTIRNQLYKSLLGISKKYGVQEVTIPHMAKIDLYKISGHAEKFADELFKVVSHYKEEFVLKPVNCPHHTQIYASKPRSYRDLPIRMIESTQQHRDEKPGQIGGLTRTRSFTVDDGHTFCTVNQIRQEALNICKIIEEFYKGLGLWGNHWVSLSVRDYKNMDKYIGEAKDWEKAENMIQEISNELNLKGKIMEGEAAIYGPKIDYMFKDALGNERQLATVQIDFAMPKRFGLTYINEKGEEVTPVMLHRAILGSYERFLAIIIEHFAGAFPVWLSPIQVQIITINESVLEYANKIKNELESLDIRVEIDEKQETMQNKIRKAQEQKIPYMLIVGDKEKAQNKVSIRTRENEQHNFIGILEFEKVIKNIVESKSLKTW
ncbi:threonine--tRNA ligase [candidate division WWE3 bacterium CG10_big_fil_rev_8_21_14_0_10_32_10]|uniref:Threonine--tRNA ligase n=1 Tax=candidate division WWE3 bacterium CG10_big_fil_rev_8_21_14_0_10_32_10 TaxID=1975090 RepID=A0A2H0RBC5_UNCKA|nr:MAG: threonine--tRNA ligase [candidate division WWE3 bacterium CG10_big_fil_rev_8_21_14_0_10_32_10]